MTGVQTCALPIYEDENHKFLYTPEGLPKAPKFGGYDNPEYFKAIVRDNGESLKEKEIKY